MRGTAVRQNVKLVQTITKVIKVFYYASVVMLVLVACMALFTALGPDRYFTAERFANNKFTFELNGLLRYRLDPARLGEGGSLRDVYSSIALAAAVYAVLFAFILHRLGEVMDTVAAENPFHRGNPKRIRDIGLAVMAAAFLIPAANSWVALRMVRSFALEDFSILYSPDVVLAFTGLLLLVLAAVFDYGCYLQEEIDQTV